VCKGGVRFRSFNEFKEMVFEYGLRLRLKAIPGPKNPIGDVIFDSVKKMFPGGVQDAWNQGMESTKEQKDKDN
jgi:hypothetical protein